MQIFLPPKEAQGKLDKVREGLRPITLRFRANARKLILGSIGTPLDHLSVNSVNKNTLSIHPNKKKIDISTISEETNK